MPETHRVPVGRAGILAIVVGAAVLSGLIGLRVFAPDNATTPTPVAAQSSAPSAPASNSQTISPMPTPTVAASPSPIATPTGAPPTLPPPIAGYVAPVVLSTAQFERVFKSRQFIGTTLLVDGTISPLEGVAERDLSDGLNCNGELACVYGRLEGASVVGHDEPLLIWSGRITRRLLPDEVADEYWWPGRDRQPLPLTGLLVLHIDTAYSVEYVGRGLVNQAGIVWTPAALAAMDLSGSPLDQVVLVDGWLGGSRVGQICPETFSELLPSFDCGRPAWVAVEADGPRTVVQPDAYEHFAADPGGVDAPDDYEPRHGLMALGQRLMRDGCSTPPCPTWHVLGWVDEDFNTSQIGAIPTPTPVPPATWIEIPQVGVISTRWSPDSRWLLVTTPTAVELVDGDTGSVMRTYESPAGMFGRGAVWLDSERFVVVHQPPAEDEVRDELAPGRLGRVDSKRLVDVRVPVGYEDGVPYVDMLAGGDGAIAFATGDDRKAACRQEACWSYVIWTPDGVTRQMSGLPVAWSASGRRLAVIHNDRQIQRALGIGAGIGDTTGWLQVVKWPSLKTIYANRHVTMTSDLSFSPAGDKVAASSVSARVVDLASGRVTNIEQSWWWPPVWNSLGNLVVTTDDGDVWIARTNGAKVEVIEGIGQLVVGTEAGTTQVAYIWDPRRAGHPRVLTIIGTRPPFDIALPALEADTLGFRPALAPDGHAVALIFDRYRTTTKQLVICLLPR